MPPLTLEQKQELYRNGYVVIRNAVPRVLTQAAKRVLFMQLLHPKKRTPKDFYAHITALVNSPQSALPEVLRDAIGPYDLPIRSDSSHTVVPSEVHPKMGIHGSGIPAHEAPFYGWWPHLDGQWYKHPPSDPEQARDIAAYRGPASPMNFAPRSGGNGAALFKDPACTLTQGSFTAFVGVALNDQSEEGRGNLGVLRSSHHDVERFFRWQRAQGGVVGPEGPGWPFFTREGRPGGLFGIMQIPPPVYDKYASLPVAAAACGVRFPRPDFVKLREGDAVVTIHALAHAGSRNERGAEPRMTAYFRIRSERPGGLKAPGDNDTPDRPFPMTKFHTYPPGYDPWEISKDCLCDIWREWPGMREVVAAERRRGGAATVHGAKL